MTTRLPRPFNVRRLTKEETVRVEASADERAAIADALDLQSIDSLVADLRIRPWRSVGVRVTGVVHGAVVQSCVVTLEPVEGTVNEEVNVTFHPDAAASSAVEIDPEADDPPEPLESDVVDLGAIALEHFALGLDPYPRAQGAAFEEPDPEVDEEPSPFAVLEVLKPKPH